MSTAETTEPRPLIPQLKPFYDAIRPLSWTLVRLTASLILLPIGWTKVTSGFAPVVASMNKWGIVPAEPMAAVVVANETLGAVCVALGLFTRFFAASITIEMSVLVYLMYPNGFNAYRYFLFWCLIMLAIWMRGGGPWSLDRLIGKEL
jgi:putative oxidoreductase